MEPLGRGKGNALWWGLAGLVAVFALAACAPTPTTQPGTKPAQPPAGEVPGVKAPAATAAPAVATRPGTAQDPYYLTPEKLGVELPKNQTGVLHYPSNAAPNTLDPHAGPAFIEWQVNMLSTYDPLVVRRLAPDIQPLNTDSICRLCESWTQPDPLTYVFKLRQNVKWHDGQPFTAADVVFSYERARNPEFKFGRVTARLADLQTVEAQDQYTVKLTTKTPSPDFLVDLEDVMIAPKHVVEKDPDALKTKAVGTGPFKLVSFDRSSKAVFEKNKDYYVQGRPWMDGIEIIYLSDKSARQAAFLANQIDFLTFNDKAEFEPVQRAKPDVGEQSFQAILGNAIAANLDRKPWDNLNVRKALHLAIDRQKLNETLTFGGGIDVNPPSTSIFRPYALTREELLKIPGFSKETKAKDIETAKQLLRDAGYPDGFKSSLFTWRAFSSTPQQVEAVGPMAKAVGINLDLQLLETGVANRKWTSRDFDLVLRPLYGQSWPNSAYNYLVAGAGENYYGVSDPVLDDLIKKSRAESNKEKRYELLRQVQRRILDQMYIIPVIELNPYAVWNKRLHNFRHYSLGAQPYPLNGVAEVMWLDK